MTSKKKRILIVSITIILILVAWTLWGNTALELNSYTISSENLPQTFDGYKIALISDLHNTQIGKGNETLISLLEEASPDIIAITGDLVDYSKTRIDLALHFVREAVKIAPCYYVTGNHEAEVDKAMYMGLEDAMLELGVDVLHDEEVVIEKNGQCISLIGIDDPRFSMAGAGAEKPFTAERIRGLKSWEGFEILLSHRPEYFAEYVKADVDLILSGHTHGGQIRLPFVGGLVAPNQGFFPEYDAGLFVDGSTHMIVSRGIGNSIIPIRVNNRPELICVHLYSQEKLGLN